ncbi:Uncharacterised protein [Chlamydia trachomatis]|nr:Uncharacterised protein [Chlamydia trachomatis]CQB87642.1 Uncharacterised protein [Chlamydia trachomatis]
MTDASESPPDDFSNQQKKRMENTEKENTLLFLGQFHIIRRWIKKVKL